ncbi:hypothetical protein [Rheinheimera baltica]|jgi:hypothetical protein|uniref:Flp pilus-assembly TadG-like N-terminal domain-containing protein n=1 Tax=Rheinheimera baltica TaxID=67576 RepID=A0ABT9HX89_9GAMM|nr:hypothetical protein [Rheinheimera baltica]MDP5135746.1 hypothetical protein [Rheinheimera baltica]MDP5142375.1 hypothetical protein [Rheinheimera baltica]MDP5150723.1 hypothetical protein [Rheinheimera baltica]MDP5189976.1 hypothetical protein [Rheinheimera baltica]
MDLFLLSIMLFLLANVAVVFSMLRRVNLNNDSVMAWEQAQVAAVNTATPIIAYTPDYLAKAA